MKFCVLPQINFIKLVGIGLVSIFSPPEYSTRFLSEPISWGRKDWVQCSCALDQAAPLLRYQPIKLVFRNQQRRQIICSLMLTFNAYLITVGDPEGDHKPVPALNCQGRDEKIVKKPSLLLGQKFRNHSVSFGI